MIAFQGYLDRFRSVPEAQRDERFIDGGGMSGSEAVDIITEHERRVEGLERRVAELERLIKAAVIAVEPD